MSEQNNDHQNNNEKHEIDHGFPPRRRTQDYDTWMQMHIQNQVQPVREDVRLLQQRQDFYEKELTRIETGLHGMDHKIDSNHKEVKDELQGVRDSVLANTSEVKQVRKYILGGAAAIGIIIGLVELGLRIYDVGSIDTSSNTTELRVIG